MTEELKIPPPAVARFEALDAWRGICALVVALEHLSITNPLQNNALVHHGYRFVDFFFVLSGFVIAHAYRDRLSSLREVRSFLVRRIGRLWPLHAALLCVLVLAELTILLASQAGVSLMREAFSDRNTLEILPVHILLMHGWGFFDQLTLNTPSWSISTEVFAYGAFAALCLFATRWMSMLWAVVVVASAAILVVAAPNLMDSTYDFGVVRCLFGFGTGVLVRALWDKHQWRIGTAGELLVLVVVLVAVILLPESTPSLLVTPIFAIAVWVFAAEDGAASRAMRRPWPQALGRWSYSIYMVHAPLLFGLLMAAMLATRAGFPVFSRIDGVTTIVGGPWFTTVVVVGYLAAVIGIARFTYLKIELKGQRLFTRWAKPSR